MFGITSTRIYCLATTLYILNTHTATHTHRCYTPFSRTYTPTLNNILSDILHYIVGHTCLQLTHAYQTPPRVKLPLPLTHQVSNEYLRPSFDGVVKGSIECGVLDLRVHIDLNTHEEYDSLYILFQDGQVQEVLSLAVHL